jgi:hypothetical protein
MNGNMDELQTVVKTQPQASFEMVAQLKKIHMENR